MNISKILILTGLLVSPNGSTAGSLLRKRSLLEEDVAFWGRELSDSTQPTPDDEKYDLKVRFGDGSGTYKAGEDVEIVAAEGFDFKGWEIVSGDPQIKDVDSPTTTLTMPEEDVVVKALLQAIPSTPQLTLTQSNNIEGGGISASKHEAGEKVLITETCDTFVKWQLKPGIPIPTIITEDPIIEDEFSPTTIVNMPTFDVHVESVCDIKLYKLATRKGTPDGKYASGSMIEIVADPNIDFDQWTIIKGNPEIKDPQSPTTTLTMPAEDVVVRALAKSQPNPCETTDNEREDSILDLLRDVSGDTVDTEGTSQNLAATWLIEEDQLFVCPGKNDKKLLQRYAMAVFYYSTEGDNWIECFSGDEECGGSADGKSKNDFSGQKSYLSAENECEWAGNECNEDKCITKIVWEENNGATGVIPSELQVLDVLEVLSLEDQEIGGSIPPELGLISTLEIIDFDFNVIEGPIPVELYNLKNLKQLDLNDNKLTGTLSSKIDSWESLVFLQLHNNTFEGALPAGLVDIPLEVAEFFGNDFSGEMPLCIGESDQTITFVSVDCAQVTCGDGCGCTCI